MAKQSLGIHHRKSFHVKRLRRSSVNQQFNVASLLCLVGVLSVALCPVVRSGVFQVALLTVAVAGH